MRAMYRAAMIAVGLGLLAGAPHAVAASLVVVEARGIGLHQGEMLDDSKPLTLYEGQHVTLIALNGTTLKIDGPYDKAPAAAQSAGSGVASAALRALVTQGGARTVEAGVTRSGGPVSALPDPWVLDVSRTGKVCLKEGAEPIFWRPAAMQAALVAVMPADRSWRANTNWPQGNDRMAIPPELPVHGGATYLVSLDKGEEAAVTVALVPTDLASDPMRIAWMAHQGCEAQAEALLRRGQ